MQDSSNSKPLNKELAAEEWGLETAILKQDPQLWKYFNQQFEKYRKNPAGFSEQAFMMGLRKQKWWQAHSDAYIKDKEFELQYPEQYALQVDADVETLRDQASKLGAQVGDDVLRQLVVKKRQGAFNAAQLTNALSDYIVVEEGRYAGASGAAQDALKQWTIKNGLQISDDALRGYVKKVVAGDQTEDDIKNELRRTYLAGAYPAWADKIEAGYDPSDLFSPYLESARSLLEDKSLGLSDPIMQKITQSVGADGKPVTVPLYEAQKEIRKDPRWQKTDNAYSTYANVANDILKTFGFA